MGVFGKVLSELFVGLKDLWEGFGGVSGGLLIRGWGYPGARSSTGYLKAVWPELFGATKWLSNWSAGLVFGATGTARRAPSF